MAKVSPVVSDTDEEMPGIVENVKEVVEARSDDEASEGDEDASEYEIEAILDAKRGVYPEGRIGYWVKWKGYPDSENSWVDEIDAVNAGDLVKEFWKKHPKKKLAPRKSMDAKTPKKPRKSVPDEGSEVESISASASAPPKKRGRKSNATENEDEEDIVIETRAPKKAKKSEPRGENPSTKIPSLEEEATITDMSKYMKVASWEELVESVDTVERVDDSQLVVYFALYTGERVKESSVLCAERFPRKLIEFYERNLRWRKVEDGQES